MKSQGPELIELTHHMETTPYEFLLEPIDSDSKKDEKIIDTKALFLDLLRNLGDKEPDIPSVSMLIAGTGNYLLLVQLLCRFFSHPWFQGKKEIFEGLFYLISEEVPIFAKYVKAEKVISNSERREEFCRLLLTACELRPLGETEIQAFERFESVSIVKRTTTIKKTLASIKRMKQIRKKMAEQAAREASNVYGRE